MRREGRRIKDPSVIESVIRRSLVCRLAMSDGDGPYVVPLCFGYRDNALFFHCARGGLKLDILRKNPEVCFEFDLDHELVTSTKSCAFGFKYKSVIGFGRASFVEDPEGKRRALDTIFEHYTGRSGEYPDAALGKTAIVKVEIRSMTGKEADR